MTDSWIDQGNSYRPDKRPFNPHPLSIGAIFIDLKRQRIFDFFSVRPILFHRMNNKSSIFTSGEATSENTALGVHE